MVWENLITIIDIYIDSGLILQAPRKCILVDLQTDKKLCKQMDRIKVINNNMTMTYYVAR